MAAGERPCLGWLQVMAFHADSLSGASRMDRGASRTITPPVACRAGSPVPSRPEPCEVAAGERHPLFRAA